MTKRANKKAEILKKYLCLLFLLKKKKKAHDSLGSYTRLFSSQIIIPTISIIKFKMLPLSPPFHFWHLNMKRHFWEWGKVLSAGLWSQCFFPDENVSGY